MATMTLSIGEEYTDPSGEGKIGVVKTSDTNCISTWSISVKTTTSVWFEWLLLGTGGSVVKDGGGTINGEQLTSITPYTASIEKFKSNDGNLNSNLSQIILTIKNIEGGTVLSTATLSRLHTGLNC